MEELKSYLETIIALTTKHIAEDELTKIWEPLYKVDKARKEAGESSGMGLAICAGILKLHGFAYSSKNVEGGVEFTFTK